MAALNEQIETAIIEFWEEVALEEASLPDEAEKFIDTLDSITAVDILVALEKIVGITLEPYKVIRRGGYESRGQFVQDLTTKVLKAVQESEAGAKT